MKQGQPIAGVVAGMLCLLSVCGCSIGSGASYNAGAQRVIERDLLADAVHEVEEASWPTPEGASMFAWITGDHGDARVTKADAAEAYVSGMAPFSARFPTLLADAETKILEARRLTQTALLTVSAPRVSMNDIALVETGIQSLREHRDIFMLAAKEIERRGGAVDEARLSALRADFAMEIKRLGDAADLLADRFESDRYSVYAQPRPGLAGDPSGL